MIEVYDGRYFHATYFFGCEGWNVHGAVYRDEGGPWTLKYRFRYDNGEVRWYSAKARLPEHTPEMFGAIMREMVNDVPPEIITDPFVEVSLGTDRAEKVLQIVLAQPWCKPMTNAMGGSA